VSHIDLSGVLALEDMHGKSKLSTQYFAGRSLGMLHGVVPIPRVESTNTKT
jgi:hypothetical protein